MRPIEIGRLADAPPQGWEPANYAEGQQDTYMVLPTIRSSDRTGAALSRWRPTWRERLRLALGADVWLEMWTFHKPLQPVRMHVGEPAFAEAALEEGDDAA